MNFSYNKKMIGQCLIIIFFVIVDRFLKFLAINNYFSNPVKIFNDIFKLNFAANFNIAFSLPFKGAWLNLIIALIIVILLYYWLFLIKNKDLRSAGYLFFIVIGAMSNLYDRLNFGYVVDYLDLKYFTAFNIADMMIVGGVVGLIWIMVFNKKERIKTALF